MNNSQSPKDKPKIKNYMISSGVTFLIFVIGYLILNSIQSLAKYGELGHFFVLGRRVRATEITDSPIVIIGYFVLLLLICVIPNLIMYVREMREYKKAASENR